MSRTYADHTALIYPEYGTQGIITYARLLELVGKAGSLLRHQGLQAGDRVIICLENQPELVVMAFACAYAGVTAVIANHRLGPNELAYLIEDSQAAWVITNPVQRDLFDTLLDRVDRMLIVSRSETLGLDEAHSVVTSCDLFTLEVDELPVASVVEKDPAFIFYTSGTTATPKGVVISHAHVIWAAEQNARQLGVNQDDRVMIVSPLYHVMGFSYQMLTALFCGASILLKKVFNPARLWDDAVQYQCTWMAVMPYMCHALAAFPIPEQHFFKFWGFGSRNLQVESSFKVPTVGWWGMTELFAIGCLTDGTDSTEPNFSVGRVVPDYDYRLVDQYAGGGPFDADWNGELQIRGERGKTLFLGYLNQPEETEQAFTDDGWFITGDRFFETKSNILYFDVRMKDIIRVGGENVSAAEIEFLVYRTGLVKEVAVIAGNDRLLGEVPIVFVIPNAEGLKDTDQARATILQTCRRSLADFKQPRDVLFVTDFPRSELNKIAKNKLREFVRGGIGPSE